MHGFKRLLLVFALLFLIAGSAHAAADYWFSPLTAVAVGPAGPPSVLSVSPLVPGPSTAIMVTSDQIVEENDFQWVLLGLTLPSGASGKIKYVKICYQVETSSSGTYISQVRLTKMTTPDVAIVIHDDPTDLTETVPTCYESSVKKKKVSGTITLALKMVFASTDDVIRIGGVKLRVSK